MLIKYALLAVVIILAVSILYDVIKRYLARRAGQQRSHSNKGGSDSTSSSEDKPGKQGEE